MAKKRIEPPPLESREFRSPEEVDQAVAKLRRRIEKLHLLDVRAAYLNHSGADKVARSNVQNAIMDVFGVNSPEYREHQYIQIWAGDQYVNMSDQVRGMKEGRLQIIAILNGLIGRLEKKKADLTGGVSPSPSTYFDRLNLHPRRGWAQFLFQILELWYGQQNCVSVARF